MILADFLCDEHGPFEARAPSDVDAVACPVCGASSPWLPTPIHGRIKRGEAARGKSDPPPFAHAMSTREIGEGMPINEWRKQRAKVWDDYRRKKNKEIL